MIGIEEQLREKLRKVEALYFGAGTAGEQEAAGAASERLRDTIETVFDVFARRRSVHGVLRYLVAHGIALPDRERAGAAKGELVWRPPHRGAVINLLTNPTYAGAYVYGRRQVGGRGRPARSSPSRAAGELAGADQGPPAGVY